MTRFEIARNVFRELTHKDTGCYCQEGFKVLKCSLNMSLWRDQEIKDIQMKALILLRYGYLARIILTSLEQANSLNDYWKLSHLIHKFFKFLRTHMEGYFNLELNLIPSSYDEGYLDEACHHIKITLHKQS